MQTQQEIIVKYTPHSHQARFHDDRYKVYARLIAAGTGGGKTLAGWYETFLWAFENSGSVGYVFEPNYKMVRRILIPTFEDLFGKPPETCSLVKTYRKLDNCITWINGSKTWFMGLDEPENAEGPNVDYIWCDEYRLVGGSGPSAKGKQEIAWRVINRRLRGSVPNKYPVGLWITTTPDAPGSVIHGKFENPKTRIKNSKIYRWSIYDNPYLRESYLREIESSHSGGLAERFIHGRFATVASGSFAFDYSIHVIPNDLIDVPSEFKRGVHGVDFGWSNPSAIIAVGVDGDGRAYVVDEFYQTRVSDETLLSEARALKEEHRDWVFYCDRSEPKTIQYLQAGGIVARADESKRDDGIREVGGRFTVQGDGKARIYIHERCTNLIAELQVYDAERKEYDHAVDALRYALSSLMGSPSGPLSIVFGRRPK